MDSVSMDVIGLADLNRKMQELGPKFSQKVLRASINAGIQVIKKEAKRNVPVDTGKIKRNIIVKRSTRESSTSRAVYNLSVRQWWKGTKFKAYSDKDAYYWKFLEFGTVKMSKKPFITPAFEMKASEALSTIKRKAMEKFNQLKATL